MAGGDFCPIGDIGPCDFGKDCDKDGGCDAGFEDFRDCNTDKCYDDGIFCDKKSGVCSNSKGDLWFQDPVEFATSSNNKDNKCHDNSIFCDKTTGICSNSKGEIWLQDPVEFATSSNDNMIYKDFFDNESSCNSFFLGKSTCHSHGNAFADGFVTPNCDLEDILPVNYGKHDCGSYDNDVKRELSEISEYLDDICANQQVRDIFRVSTTPKIYDVSKHDPSDNKIYIVSGFKDIYNDFKTCVDDNKISVLCLNPKAFYNSYAKTYNCVYEKWYTRAVTDMSIRAFTSIEGTLSDPGTLSRFMQDKIIEGVPNNGEPFGAMLEGLVDFWNSKTNEELEAIKFLPRFRTNSDDNDNISEREHDFSNNDSSHDILRKYERPRGCVIS